MRRFPFLIYMLLFPLAAYATGDSGMGFLFSWSMTAFGVSTGALLCPNVVRRNIALKTTVSRCVVSVFAALGGAVLFGVLFTYCAMLIISPSIPVENMILIGLFAIVVLTLTIVGPPFGVFAICLAGGIVGLQAAKLLDVKGKLLRVVVKLGMVGLLIALLFGVSMLPLLMF